MKTIPFVRPLNSETENKRRDSGKNLDLLKTNNLINEIF
jgi:hypothetical protein